VKNSPKHLTIKSLSEDDRPREKLATLGRQNLSDAELIAIILGSC
jgi:DNA repair protein RadC